MASGLMLFNPSALNLAALGSCRKVSRGWRRCLAGNRGCCACSIAHSPSAVAPGRRLQKYHTCSVATLKLPGQSVLTVQSIIGLFPALCHGICELAVANTTMHTAGSVQSTVQVCNQSITATEAQKGPYAFLKRLATEERGGGVPCRPRWRQAGMGSRT